MLADFLHAHARIAFHPGLASISLPLDFPGFLDPPPQGRSRFPRIGAQEIRHFQARHLDMQIHPIQHGSADAAPVAGYLFGAARASLHAIEEIPAGTRVHGRAEDETAGKTNRARYPGQLHITIFQGLPQRFQSRPMEFGPLVQEEQAVVGQTRLPGPELGSAADEGMGARGMMRLTKRPLGDEAAFFGQKPRASVYAGGFQGFALIHGRQDAGHPAGHHGFSATGTADEDEVVTAGGRDFQGAARQELPAQVAEIGIDFAPSQTGRTSRVRRPHGFGRVLQYLNRLP